MATKSKRSNTIKVDFTGVQAGGGRVLLPEGPMKFEVEEVTLETSEKSGSQYLAAKLRVFDGKYEGKYAYDNWSLQPQALFKLRGVMEAGGLEVEDGEMEIDPDELIGLIVVGDVVHEEYKGKPQTRIAGYSSVEDHDGEEEEEDEKPAKATKAAPKKTPAKVQAEDEEEDEDDEETSFKVKQAVKFKDGKKWVTGKIKSIEEDVITVTAGNEEYEMNAEDLQPA